MAIHNVDEAAARKKLQELMQTPLELMNREEYRGAAHALRNVRVTDYKATPVPDKTLTLGHFLEALVYPDTYFAHNGLKQEYPKEVRQFAAALLRFVNGYNPPKQTYCRAVELLQERARMLGTADAEAADGKQSPAALERDAERAVREAMLNNRRDALWGCEVDNADAMTTEEGRKSIAVYMERQEATRRGYSGKDIPEEIDRQLKEVVVHANSTLSARGAMRAENQAIAKILEDWLKEHPTPLWTAKDLKKQFDAAEERVQDIQAEKGAVLQLVDALKKLAPDLGVDLTPGRGGKTGRA